MSSILNQERRTWTRSVGTKNCSSPALSKDGSLIWDEGLRITLHSVQRYIVSGITSPDVSPGIATWRGLRQPCVPACSSPALRPGMILASLASRHDPLPALRPLMLLSAMRPAEGGITSRRSRHCVHRCSSVQCV